MQHITDDHTQVTEPITTEAEEFPIGCEVEITGPGIYCDVHKGKEGIVDCRKDGGYGILLSGRWNPGDGGRKDAVGERVLWFAEGTFKKKAV